MRKCLLILLGCAISALLLCTVQGYLRVVSYPAFYQAYNRMVVPTYPHRLGLLPNIFLHYNSVPAADVNLVSSLIRAWHSVLEELFPEIKAQVLHVVICEDRQALRDAIPFFAGKENLLGVYQTGRIYLLAPSVWLTELDVEGVHEVYRSQGPVLHELVHWSVDVVTRGSCPLWLNEGVAQYLEFKYQGYQWQEAEVTRSHYYELQELQTSFAKLSDQALAYRQTLLMVAYLADQYSLETLLELLRLLGRGWSLNRALAESAGVTPLEWHSDWLKTLSGGGSLLSGVPRKD